MNDKYLFFETMLDNVKEAIYILDDKGNYLFVNKMFLEITHNTRDEILSSNVYSLVKEGALDFSVSEIVYRTKRSVTMFQDIYRDGKANRYLVFSTPIFDHEGNIQNIVAHLQPVSDIKKRYLAMLMDEMQLTPALKEADITDDPEPEIICHSKKMKEVIALADKVADIDSTILLSGESGVGKDVVAHYIHNHSARRDKEFVEINCAALPESLLEAELFGYEKGSFTGALQNGKRGLLEEADGGTLFLDEVNSLPLALQGKLLRVLETKMVKRVGANKPNYVDFRLICATNKNLKQAVDDGAFRLDLYYRLRVLPIDIPPLRDRVADIIPMALLFLQQTCKKYRKNKIFTRFVYDQMLQYPWPGNVRELKNFVERMVIMSADNVVEINDIPQSMLDEDQSMKALEQEDDQKYFLLHFQNRIIDYTSEDFSLKTYLDECEKQLLTELLRQYGNTYKVAELLKTNQSTISRKKARYGIDY